MWEHCICTLHKVMKAVLNKQPYDEGVVTLWCEIEAIINRHPLTKVCDDPRDPEALTPNHLLLLHLGTSLPPAIFLKEECCSQWRWRHFNTWMKCTGDGGCRNTFPHFNKDKSGVTLRRILQFTPKGSWPLGNILEVFPFRVMVWWEA